MLTADERRQAAENVLRENDKLQVLKPDTLAHQIALGAIESAILQADREVLEAQCAAVTGFAQAAAEHFPAIAQGLIAVGEQTAAGMRILGAHKSRMS